MGMMSSGMGYSDREEYAELVGRAERQEFRSLAEFSDALCVEPLLFKAGDAYEYGFSTDILGRICERLSGQRIDKFVADRILKPLGMKDTSFVIPAAKRRRVAQLYDAGAEVSAAKRRRIGAYYDLKPYSNPSKAPTIMSPGGGILSYHDAGAYSTARDYLRFCQMLLDGGVSLSGRQILKPSTLKMLWRDGLAPIAKGNGRVKGWSDSGGKEGVKYWDRVSWTLLNTHVCFDEQPQKGITRTGVSMFMGGGGGTYWVLDKKRKTVALSFTQTLNGRGLSDGSDGLGPRANDCGPYVEAAATHRKEIIAHHYGQYGPPCCNVAKLKKGLVVKVPFH